MGGEKRLDPLDEKRSIVVKVPSAICDINNRSRIDEFTWSGHV